MKMCIETFKDIANYIIIKADHRSKHLTINLSF